MMKLPKNYGRNCFLMMIISIMAVMVISLGIYVFTGDMSLAMKFSNIGTPVVLLMFGALAIPCALNYHSKRNDDER